MTALDASEPGRRAGGRRAALAAGARAYGAIAGLLLVAALLSALVVPGLRTHGDVADVVVEALGTGNAPDGTRRVGATVNVDGFVVGPGTTASVSLPVQFATPAGQRSILRLWVYGGAGVDADVSLEGPEGALRRFGRAGYWEGRAFDVTETVRRGTARVRVTASNRGSADALFFDQAVVTIAGPDATPAAGGALVALWLAALVALGLAAGRRLSAHWMLPVAAGVLALTAWPVITAQSLAPLPPDAAALWTAARGADLLSLHGGLLSGSFGELSPLAVQLLHALTLVVGDGGAGARIAGLLLSVGALCAIYAVGHRAGGRLAAITAVGVALALDEVRHVAVTGTALPAQLLAVALLLYGLHMCLAEASPYAVGALGAFGALAFLADPLYAAGIVLAIVVVVAAHGIDGRRWQALGAGLLVLFVLILPNRVSVADQSGGNLLGDTDRRATYARNVEFAGKGHGAGSVADVARNPFGGRPVGLASYLFAEHSTAVVAGGSLTAARDGLEALGRRETSGIFGLLAFAAALLGAALLLLVPRLRLLVVLPLGLAAPGLFLASRGVGDPLAAGVALWPALFVAAGVAAYVARDLLAARYGARLRGLTAALRRGPRASA